MPITFSYDDTSDEQELVADARRHADEELATGQTIGTDEEAMYKYLVRAMRHVINTAPRGATDVIAVSGSGQSPTNKNECTEIPVPDDFSRFLDLRLGSWGRSVLELTDPRDNDVRLQFHAKTRADAANPIVAKVPHPSADAALWAWPQDGAATIDRFMYVPEVAPEGMAPLLQGAVVLKAASYALAADQEQAWQVMDQAQRQYLSRVQAGEQPMLREAIQEARGSE
jgi:hypothetical protein